MIEPGNSFAGSFYDLETSVSLCANSSAIEGEPQTKIGKELYCLRRLLGQYCWADNLECQAVNLIDLGTGSGTKAAWIIDALAQAGIRPISFLPVDLSPYCASFAILTVLAS